MSHHGGKTQLFVNNASNCKTAFSFHISFLYDFFFLFSFMTAQCGLQFSPRGLRPSCSLMTARHLDQNTMGYLQWRWGPNSAMTTSLVRDTKSSHFTLALQVHSKISMHTKAAAVLRHYFYKFDHFFPYYFYSLLLFSWLSNLHCPAGRATLLPDDELPVQVPG